MKTYFAYKRIMAFLLAVCMMLSVAPVSAGTLETPHGLAGWGGMAPLAAATATARVIVGYQSLYVRLTEGAFAASSTLDHNKWNISLPSGMSIQGITRMSDTVVVFNLSALVGAGNSFTIYSVDATQFAAGTTALATPLAVEVKTPARAVGAAVADAGTKEILVTLTGGEFNPTQLLSYWTLAGAASSGNSISGITYIDVSHVKITLNGDIGASDELTINSTVGAFLDVSTWQFAAPLPVTVSTPPTVCSIGATEYTSLTAALAAVNHGETITLLQDIDHVTDSAAKIVRISGKTVIFDLAGYTLNVGDASVSAAVVVENGGRLELLGDSGELNVIAYGDAVQAVGVGSAATVTSATSVNNIGVYATGGGQVTVRGDAVGNTHGVGAGAPSDTVGSSVAVGGNVKTTVDNRTALAASKGSQVTVNGSVLTNNTNGYGISAGDPSTEVWIKGNVQGLYFFCVDARDSAKVRVDGNVTSTYAAPYVCGVRAQTKAEVTVGGNISVNNQTGSSGVRVNSLSDQTPTQVTVDGTISGKVYIQLDGYDKTAEQKTSTEAGYNVYTLTNNHGTHTVRVKVAGAPTQLAKPTGLAWDTAAAGAIQAKWNAVAGARGYEVRLYKVGDSQGHHGILDTNTTSVDFIAALQTAGAGSYTFTVKALAPSGSTDYVDSTVATSGIYTYGVTMNPATGNAWATLYTKSIFVRLSQGGFKAVQDKADWILGGDGASGTSIADVTWLDNTEVKITLAHEINAIVQLTITADQGAFATGTTPFAAPLTVRLDNPPTFVCTIDGVAYPSLKSALAFALAPTVDKRTIVLAADIRYEEPVEVIEKTLTFNLNGKNLVIDTSGTVTGDWLTASALKVDNGSVNYTGEGKFTVCGERRGVEAINGGQVRVSEILIKNPGSPYPKHYYVYGVYAQNKNSEDEGSHITVTGGIRTLSGKPCDYATGALAGQDSTVTVGGDIFLEGNNVIGLSAGSFNDGNGTVTAQNVTVMGESATGVSAAGKSTATVNGAVTATGAYAVGVSAELAESGSGGTVIVKGDAAVTGNASTGVACLSSASATAKSMVTVDGTVSGEHYLNIDNDVRAKDTKNSVTGGYWIYNGPYASVVKVKEPDGGTPGGNVPTAPQNFTATPGNGQMNLRWTAPMSSGDSAITGYQVSKDGDTSWTNVGLTTAYTFINLTNGTEYTFKVRAVSGAGNGAEASVSAIPSDSAQTSFTVNFYSNGTLYTSRSVIKGSTLGGSWPANPTRSGYTFGGWFTGQNGAGIRYTSSNVITAALDLYAYWSYHGGSGNGGGSYTPPPTKIPIAIEKQPHMPTLAKQSVTGTVQDGDLSANITEQMARDAIKAAQDAAKKSGEEIDGIALSFQVMGSDSDSNLNVTIDAAAIARMRAAGIRFLKIGSALLDLTCDTEAITAIDEQSAGIVTLTVMRLTKLSVAAKQLIGKRPVFNISLSHQQQEETAYITDFGKGAVTIGIAYEAADGERIGNLQGVYLPRNGKPQLLTNSSYDKGRLSFSRHSLSAYGVGYRAPAPVFSDTAKHWAKHNIDFITSRQLITGIDATIFAPNTAITRADFLMALVRLSGAEVTTYTSSSFADVKADDPALPYIEWAVKNKIVAGIGGGKFGPTLSISRQDMAVMMRNYARATGYQLPTSVAVIKFTDDAQIASYAKEAVRAIQQARIMQGKGSNIFDPLAGTTRAEAATILRRLLELVIDEGTPRGWVQNDSGQWLYIQENGQPVTGWLTLANGKYRYYFDADGSMVSDKWLEIDGKWYYFYADGALAQSTKIGDYEVDENGVRRIK